LQAASQLACQAALGTAAAGLEKQNFIYLNLCSRNNPVELVFISGRNGFAADFFAEQGR
jgi:hypothetical protein